MAVSDTLRGYRTQFLYTLYRVVVDKRDDYIYVPEGKEDLDIFCGDNMIEAVQVKNLNHSVAFNDLKSKAAQTSFFGRGCEFIRQYPNVKLRLISFNGISHKLEDVKQLSSYLKGDSLVRRELIQDILDSFVPESITEEYLLDAIINELKSEYSAFTPNVEIKYLLQWIYTLAESRSRFTLTDLHTQILSFRRVLNAESTAVGQLGIRVKRLFVDSAENILDIESLNAGFRKGISVSPHHISANLDIRRQKWLDKIEQTFESYNTVVVHGASGQGKSALCYRYAHDYYSFAFEITNLLNQNIAEVIATLEEISAELRVPVLIYFDVKPSERTWLEVVRELSRHKNVHVLISIREEDWNSNSNVIDRITEYGDIQLELSEEEAKALYKVTCPTTPLCRFYDIWENLGEDVPLLEYLYSINHETTLRSMLESQYNGLSTLQKKIVSYIVIPNYLDSTVSEEALYEFDEVDPIELSSNLSDLMDEYFVNINGNLEGLHPVRTEILKDIITRDNPATLFTIGKRWIGKLSINNLDRYIINLFRNGIELGSIIQTIASLPVINAKTCYNIVIALLWKSCSDYVDTNRDKIDELREIIGPAYSWFIPINFTEIDTTESLQTIFKEKPKLLEECNKIKSTMEGQERLFDSLAQWLHNSKITVEVTSKAEFGFLGKTLYLLSLANLGDKINLSGLKPAKGMGISSEDLALLLLGFKNCNLMPNKWQEIEEEFIRSARDFHNIYNLKISSKSVDAIISLSFKDGFEDSNSERKKRTSFINGKVLDVCEAFRMAFPDKDIYNCSIECGDITEIMIDTVKTISHKNLPVRLMYIPRNMVCNIYAQKLKTDSKQSYYHKSIEQRNAYLRCLSSFSSLLKNILECTKYSKELDAYSKAFEYAMSLPPLELPIRMLDPLSIENIHEEKSGIKDIYSDVRSYSAAFNEYTQNISNFISQSLTVLTDKTSTYAPTKYLLYNSLEKLKDMRLQTLLFGNPYGSTNEFEQLCNKEERTIIKLLEQWSFVSKRRGRPIKDAIIKAKSSVSLDTLIKRCLDKLEIAVAYFHLKGQVYVNDDTISLKLEYAEFGKLYELDTFVRGLLLLSFIPSEWISAEQYIFESTIKNIEIEFYYRHTNGTLFNISGTKYRIASKDIFTISESDKWDLHLRREPNEGMAVPESIKRFDQIRSTLNFMILIGSQTEKLSAIIDSHDTIGQNMYEKLINSYKDVADSIVAYIEECKKYVDSIELDILYSPFVTLCDNITNLCHSRSWLDCTIKTRTLLNELNNAELPIKRILLSTEI